jgi:hypothetical protein
MPDRVGFVGFFAGRNGSSVAAVAATSSDIRRYLTNIRKAENPVDIGETLISTGGTERRWAGLKIR